MVSQKKGNPCESVNLSGDTQRGLGETRDITLVLISHISVRQRTVINVSQNYQNTMTPFFVFAARANERDANTKAGSFFYLFWWSL